MISVGFFLETTHINQIRHAVLNNIESRTAENARIYMKSVPNSFDDDPRLTSLKEELRNTPGIRVADYTTPTSLADLVLKDLTEIIERDYPTQHTPSPLGTNAHALI